MKWMAGLGAAMAAVAWLVPAGAAAQQSGNPNDPWCREGSDRDRGYYCEVREMTLARPGGVLTVDASPNGGVKIVGSNAGDVSIRARVSANADTNEQAQALAREISVQTGATIRSDGPDRDGNRGWSVSYEISVPSDQSLSVATINGGISISNVRAEVDFRTQNGGITLADVGGSFKGQTRNGGIHVSLQGQRWDGDGLEVTTQNGGINVQVPEGFAAHVETSTVNGGIRTDLPVMIAGEADRRHLTGDLNGGGPTLRLKTINGGVSILKR